MPMGEYFIQYLNEKFPDDPRMVTEWAYNLDNACQRYVHDTKIQLFSSVLNDQVCVHASVFYQRLLFKLVQFVNLL